MHLPSLVVFSLSVAANALPLDGDSSPASSANPFGASSTVSASSATGASPTPSAGAPNATGPQPSPSPSPSPSPDAGGQDGGGDAGLPNRLAGTTDFKNSQINCTWEHPKMDPSKGVQIDQVMIGIIGNPTDFDKTQDWYSDLYDEYESKCDNSPGSLYPLQLQTPPKTFFGGGKHANVFHAEGKDAEMANAYLGMSIWQVLANFSPFTFNSATNVTDNSPDSALKCFQTVLDTLSTKYAIPPVKCTEFQPKPGDNPQTNGDAPAGADGGAQPSAGDTGDATGGGAAGDPADATEAGQSPASPAPAK